MSTGTLRLADVGSLTAVALSLVLGLLTLPVLPAEVAIHWAADGSPNTVVPALPGVLLTPAIALLAFGYFRGGTVIAGWEVRLGPRAGLSVVAGVAYLQVALNLSLLENPLLAIAPGAVAILVATYGARIGATTG
ncbi:DUF1648 domain-containing protein [Haloferax sulfurifontis]|uniref:DUF1648 domain-containing protein n=1 Tax=Haloferax sulfurifontis ATCC BAA-897 TaxID=662480 RepID=M0IIW8_9EURY|nr:DUF1648 domain-containing protein [Haloferax sulfurifontis]ELZ96705.1 hypothetical protein C441_04164 [Haloferax sulfurifontis ATCC BAA-897]